MREREFLLKPKLLTSSIPGENPLPPQSDIQFLEFFDCRVREVFGQKDFFTLFFELKSYQIFRLLMLSPKRHHSPFGKIFSFFLPLSLPLTPDFLLHFWIGATLASFCLFSFFLIQFYKQFVDLNGIQTWILGQEGQCADHVTLNMAIIICYNLFLKTTKKFKIFKIMYKPHFKKHMTILKCLSRSAFLIKFIENSLILLIINCTNFLCFAMILLNSQKFLKKILITKNLKFFTLYWL